MFGFRVSLFNKPFELPLPPAPANRLAWHDSHSRPSVLLTDTFPHTPNAFTSRKKIQKRCNKFLALRNRVIHPETIWKYDVLPQTHRRIMDMIGWISPRMRATIALCDDFPITHAGGRAAIESRLKSSLDSQ